MRSAHQHEGTVTAGTSVSYAQSTGNVSPYATEGTALRGISEAEREYAIAHESE